MKVAIISNNTSDIIRSRGELIKEIVKKGHQVIAIGNEDVNKKRFAELGITAKNIKFNEISVNLFKNIKYIISLTKVLKEEKIDIVLAYTPKPIICGAIAGKIAKVKNSYALFAGMGYQYSINTVRTVFTKLFCNIGYRIACVLNKKIIVQNKEDREELIKRHFINEKKVFLVDGSGVNLEKFKKAENKIENMNKLKFLMISRGLNVKGIKELSLAANKIHKKYPNITFTHIGKIEDTYRDIKESELKEYSKDIKFIGKVNNVYDYIKEANVVVLPSYLREGVPRVLLEALAVGRPIITTNLRGCKETVIDGKNGYLVEAKNVEDLENKILLIIMSSKDTLKKMSEESYKIAKERFDVNIINKKMLEIMEL